MKTPFVVVVLSLVLSSLEAHAGDAKRTFVKGWSVGGKSAQAELEYEAVVDRTASRSGRSGALIRSKVDRPQTTLYLTQAVASDEYRGKRVRMTGYSKTGGQARLRFWCQAWSSDKYLVGDAMRDRPVMGETAWAKSELVFDVPLDAVRITFGVAYEGAGTAWVDDISLEVVDASVPTTIAVEPKQPINLGFEE